MYCIFHCWGEVAKGSTKVVALRNPSLRRTYFLKFWKKSKGGDSSVPWLCHHHQHNSYHHLPTSKVIFWTRCHAKGPFLISFIVLPISKITKHGIVTLALPSRTFLMDLTVHMDIRANPGPETVISARSATGSKLLNSNVPAVGNIEYSRSDLLKLKSKYIISEDIYRVLKTNDILRTRGKRCGLAVQGNIYKIPVRLTFCDSVDTS